MTSQQIITVYEQVAELSTRMVHAARAGEWDQLVALEEDCALQIDTLRRHDTPVFWPGQHEAARLAASIMGRAAASASAATAQPAALPEPLRQHKVELIQKILADDKEIRNLVEPWMQQLSALINSTGAERKLSRAYGATPGG